MTDMNLKTRQRVIALFRLLGSDQPGERENRSSHVILFRHLVQVLLNLQQMLATRMALLHLSAKDRAHLAQLLLESLDQLPESEVRELWLAEATRRAG